MSTPDALSALLSASPTDPDAVKACCAAAYGLDLVELLLGESYHPGGADLTRRLAETLELGPDDRVLDVASGVGTTAFLLAADFGVEVVGVDLGEAQVTKARTRAGPLGLEPQVRFEPGDAERLTFPDASFDAVICECALCTFPGKPAAVAEMARVLQPGGRAGITDVWLDPDRLDPELRGLAGRIACLADARPIDDVCLLLQHAGLHVTHIERHDDALLTTIEQVEARLRALRLADLPALRGVDLRRGIELARRAADAVDRGEAGYMLLTAIAPHPS